MKKILFVLLWIAVFSKLSGQNVGIGTPNPENSAKLEVSSTNSGFLMPRMNTSLREGILNPATGLLVFDTDTNSFWYYAGTQWIDLQAWQLGGNAGTDPNTHFIGTKDDKPLKFKINSTAAGELNSLSNTSFGLNSSILSGGSQNTAIGAFSLANNTGIFNSGLGFSSLYSNISGNSNVAVGSYAAYLGVDKSNIVAIGDSALYHNGTDLHFLFSPTQGIKNTAIGSKTLFANTTGSENTAIGYNSQKMGIAGRNNTSLGNESLYNGGGLSNTAVGDRALRNNNGWYNTAFGVNSLLNNDSGQSNTAIGTGTLSTLISGSNNTALGFGANISSANRNNATVIGARAYADCDNCIVLGSINGQNGGDTNVNVGIGISNPQASLEVDRGSGVNGTAFFRGTNYNSAFNFTNTEYTYIRGGKAGSSVFINDVHNGSVNLASGGGIVQIGNGGLYAGQTGLLNLIPLGVISMNLIFQQDGNLVSQSIENVVGNVYQSLSYTVSTNSNGNRDYDIKINHNASAINGYSNIFTIGDAGFSSNLYETTRARKLDMPGFTQFLYTTDGTNSLLARSMSSTFIVYGIK